MKDFVNAVTGPLFSGESLTGGDMTEKPTFQSHHTWIISLLACALFNGMLQYVMWGMWTGGSLLGMWWGCIIGCCVTAPLGLYYGVLFVIRNRGIISSWRQVVMPILSMVLVIGNLICVGFVLLFLSMVGSHLISKIPQLMSDFFIAVFSF